MKADTLGLVSRTLYLLALDISFGIKELSLIHSYFSAKLKQHKEKKKKKRQP